MMDIPNENDYWFARDSVHRRFWNTWDRVWGAGRCARRWSMWGIARNRALICRPTYIDITIKYNPPIDVSKLRCENIHINYVEYHGCVIIGRSFDKKAIFFIFWDNVLGDVVKAKGGLISVLLCYPGVSIIIIILSKCLLGDRRNQKNLNIEPTYLQLQSPAKNPSKKC